MCVGKTCVPGNPPCPAALCNESTDTCDDCTSSTECDDGAFCNGLEACSGGDCVPGSDPCPGQQCDETLDRCFDCLDSGECDDGSFCNGTESCVNGACVTGNPPCPAGLCDEGTDTCNDCSQASDCDDGQFCNGSEACVGGDCVPGSDPCPDGPCNEVANSCDACTTASQCDDGVFCNGTEDCVSGGCQFGSDPCPGLLCDEALDACVECFGSGPCDDNDLCTENDACLAGACIGTPLDCDDGDPCTNDWCNSLTGICEHGPFDPEHFTENCGACSVNLALPQFIAVNDDDDNENGTPDVQEPGPVLGENDLIPVSVDTSGCDPGQFGCDPANVEWHMCELGGNRHYTIYLNANKEGPVSHGGESPGPPPATAYIEGTDAWPCPAPVYFWLNYGNCCWDSAAAVTVVKVESLEWRARTGNQELGDCPNNGGKRIFPGKLSPTDADPGARRQVDLVATVYPPIEGVPVDIGVWDVDDPFDQLHGPTAIDPDPNTPGNQGVVVDVDLLDNDRDGADNRPYDAMPNISFGVLTDANGEAKKTVNVSMQPGNNYRAAATALPGLFFPNPQVGQADADALSVVEQPDGTFLRNGDFAGYQVPVVWSKMLTVWRKLTIEVDSMEQESQDFNDRFPVYFEHDNCTIESIDVNNPGPGFTTVYCSGEDDHVGAYAGIDFFEGGALACPSGGGDHLIVRSRIEDRNVVVIWGLLDASLVGQACKLRDDDLFFCGSQRAAPATSNISIG